uniref:Uncharacterized protein n=1 Tax=Moniliophthora roreri TaxID=221103 RepID=A0A0W0FQT0_MONRR
MASEKLVDEILAARRGVISGVLHLTTLTACSRGKSAALRYVVRAAHGSSRLLTGSSLAAPFPRIAAVLHWQPLLLQASVSLDTPIDPTYSSSSSYPSTVSLNHSDAADLFTTLGQDNNIAESDVLDHFWER